MDIRAIYKKIKNFEATIAPPYVVTVSLETADGGQPDVMTEVSRAIAAQLIVEGRARQANDDESKKFYADMASAIEAYHKAETAHRLHVLVVDPPAEDNKPKSGKS